MFYRRAIEWRATLHGPKNCYQAGKKLLSNGLKKLTSNGSKTYIKRAKNAIKRFLIPPPPQWGIGSKQQ